MAEHAAAYGERAYTDFDRALVAGELYHTETHTYRYENGEVATVPVTRPPMDIQLRTPFIMSRLVSALELRWATVAAVNAFGNPATEWRIAVRTTMVDSTRKEPLYPGSYAMVNRPCKVPLHTPLVIRKGEEETAGLYWADAVDYGLTGLELAKYETVSARMAQIRTHCNNGITRDERRELQYWDLLARHQHNIHARILRSHAAWLRRRSAVAAFEAATKVHTPLPEPTPVPEW